MQMAPSGAILFKLHKISRYFTNFILIKSYYISCEFLQENVRTEYHDAEFFVLSHLVITRPKWLLKALLTLDIFTKSPGWAKRFIRTNYP